MQWYTCMCLCLRDSQESSELDELAAGSSHIHNAGRVSGTDLCTSKLLITYLELLLT